MARHALIGHTGFVGRHLSEQHQFDVHYNSKNSDEMLGQEFDLLVCSGIRAEKWLANRQPEKDWAGIEGLLEKLKKVSAKQVVLISTIDVYPTPVEVDEDSLIDPETCHVYGKHRLLAEQAFEQQFDNLLIIRLPALFGRGLKKNFIYDLIHVEPKFITADKFPELLSRLSQEEQVPVTTYYAQDENRNYYLASDIPNNALHKLRQSLLTADFTSMMFTHHESAFQFYDLKHLWQDIKKCLELQLPLVNITSEPITAEQLAKSCCNRIFTNETAAPPLKYDVKTKYVRELGADRGYLYSRAEVMQDLKNYFQEFAE